MIELKTKDGVIIEIEEQYAVKSKLLKNILERTKNTAPIEILVDSETMTSVYSFMTHDNHILQQDYNPLEIYFSNENLTFFDDLSSDKMLKVCNAANYLEYCFLLELCCKIIANELSENSRSELAEIIKGTDRVDNEAVGKLKKEYEWFDEAI